jgi:hypothetical protein
MMTNAELDSQVIELDRRRLFTLFRDLRAESKKEWLVHNLLGAGEASAFYGKPGDGKSVLHEDMDLHIAAGWPWHGRAVRQGAVLYVALERRMLVERRAIAFRQRHGITDLPFAIVGGVHDFRDKRTATYIADLARQVEDETGSRMAEITIDTVSRALCGGDENSPKDMGAIVAATSLLQEKTGAHISWLHHMPLDGGERMRGHGALLGALDTTIHVVKAGPVRTATVVKANDSEEGEHVAFTLESVTVGPDTTAPVVVPADSSHARSIPSTRKLAPKHKLALEALTEAVLACGQAAPASLQLPTGIQVVPIDSWRDELFRREVINKTDPNPRQDFKRIRDSLASKHVIGMQEGVAWVP